MPRRSLRRGHRPRARRQFDLHEQLRTLAQKLPSSKTKLPSSKTKLPSDKTKLPALPQKPPEGPTSEAARTFLRQPRARVSTVDGRPAGGNDASMRRWVKILGVYAVAAACGAGSRGVGAARADDASTGVPSVAESCTHALVAGSMYAVYASSGVSAAALARTSAIYQTQAAEQPPGYSTVAYPIFVQDGAVAVLCPAGVTQVTFLPP
jgi:hypothetical protein